MLLATSLNMACINGAVLVSISTWVSCLLIRTFLYPLGALLAHFPLANVP